MPTRSELLVLATCDELAGHGYGVVLDSDIAGRIQMGLEIVRDRLRGLDREGFVDLVPLGNGTIKASVTPRGREELAKDEVGFGTPAPTLHLINQVKVVPKGLRAYDEHDKDFFLELLPGPRRGDGLPESVHFWKVRIEEMDPDKSFKVGVIFGPSGCGKSSLVKAGLLPRLSDSVITVYLEASENETGIRLLKGLRKHFPDLPADLDLPETLRELLARSGCSPKKKVVIILDQFEQWLQSNRGEEEPPLAKVLSQCDGQKVQAILMIRDDFWMAMTRFMGKVGVELHQWQNFAAVDLFDLRHAKEVLTAFGQAFDALPQDLDDLTKGQKEFLELAIRELAQDGKIISVRLALFVEMVKSKPWTQATLAEVGGTAGIGVRFLEETFSSKALRGHQKAAQGILNSLLPVSGSNIKGHIRSHEVLLEASGYTTRPTAFIDILRILDEEVRLITPTDPGAAEDQDRKQPALAEGKFYQLTHDYLVPSIRDWLQRIQNETCRGRAQLLLAERAANWSAKPENRLLLSAGEWVRILTLTKRHGWTGPERKMMRRAGWLHGLRVITWTIVASGFFVATLSIYADGLVQQLLKAELNKVPEIVQTMRFFRWWTDPALRRVLDETPEDKVRKLHARIALLPVDRSQLPFLEGRLYFASPAQLPVLWTVLEPYKTELTPKLWSVLALAKPEDGRFLHAASALALYDAGNPNWDKFVGKVAEAMVLADPADLGTWLSGLRPVRGKLMTPLVEIFRRKGAAASDGALVTSVLSDYASDDDGLLVDLLLDSEEKPFTVLFKTLRARNERAVPLLEEKLATAKKASAEAKDDEKDKLDQRQARAAVALVRLEQGEKVWNLLRHSPDPSVRSYIVNWLKPLGADPEGLISRLLNSSAHNPVSTPKDEKSRMDSILFHPETSERRALILALGGYEAYDLSPTEREPVIAQLLEAYRSDPDAGVHGAAEWTLRRWKQEETLKKVDAELMKLKDRGDRRWYLNSEGQTFSVIEGPVEFWMGSPPTEPDRFDNETLHRQSICRNFALATKEVTVAQYTRFQTLPIRFTTGPDGPMNSLSWYNAAAYCNWLSRTEGFDKSQWCYEPNSKGEYADGMKIVPDFLERYGYRLPTDAEWEYACRAGAVTSRYYGASVKLLGQYAWFLRNSEERARPCGQLKPNDLGLFDLLGNVFEWCQDAYVRHSPRGQGEIQFYDARSSFINNNDDRLTRGGTINAYPAYVRSADRGGNFPLNNFATLGFRLSRTYP